MNYLNKGIVKIVMRIISNKSLGNRVKAFTLTLK